MENFEVEAVIEMPSGSRYKYEVDICFKSKLVLDRILKIEVPFNYGFIPETLGPDFDPLDIFVLSFDPIYPLTNVKATVIGALKCMDNGVSDDKILAILVGEESMIERTNSIDSIVNYLSTYKEGFVVNELVGPEEAQKILTRDRENYAK
jgi:inorganic pyrophosphatase